MRQFYLLIQKGQPLVAELTWSHYVQLLNIEDINKINYYIEQVVIYKLSKRQLNEKIKNKEYERLPIETKNKLSKQEETKVNDFIKNPILIRNRYNYEEITEKVLKQLILEDLSNFLS